MFGIVERNNSIYITYDGDYIHKIVNRICDIYKISPYNLFNILNEQGKCNEKTFNYEFENFEIAGKTVDIIKSYLVINKLVGE